MAAPTNTITTAQMLAGLDREMIRNFEQENDRLMEILGITGVEVMNANTTLFMTKVNGSLSTATRAEGEEVPLSQYSLEKIPVGTFTPDFFRKATTAEAVLKSGFESAVGKTDDKMVTQIRAKRIKEFFDFLALGTGDSFASTLQAILAQTDAVIDAALEDNGDEAERIFHFVNTFDIADYLATANITTQTAYGMRYIETFLGVNDIFVTNKVPKGTVYATPGNNIHLFGCDFAELAKAGLDYTTSANGLLGVAHDPAYRCASCETHAASGMMLFPEVKDYIIVGSMTKLDDMSLDQLKAYAKRHSIDITGKTAKADILAVIKAAE